MEDELEIVRQHMASSGPNGVNVGAILGALGVGYDVRPIPSGESGWIETTEDGFQVVINADDSLQRQRFTAAHELAHYLLHRDLLVEHGRMNRHTDRLYGVDAALNRVNPLQQRHEVQANKLAAQIVMPASRIREARKEELSLDSLARRFGVSSAAMKIRLKTLELSPYD